MSCQEVLDLYSGLTDLFPQPLGNINVKARTSNTGRARPHLFMGRWSICDESSTLYG